MSHTRLDDHTQRDLLEKIFSNIHAMVAYLDKDFNFVRVNDAYATADNKTPDFFPGKNHFALYPNGENEAIFRQVLVSGEPYIAYARPFVYPDRPGLVTYWDWSLHPVRDATGHIDGLLLALNNVTERVRQEQARLQSEEKFHLLFDHANDAIFIHDTQGRFLEVNNVACQRLGYTREELLARSVADIDAPQAAAQFAARTQQLLAAGQLLFETEHVRRDGSSFPVEVNARRIQLGDQPAVLSIARDISERKRSAQALALSHASLQALIDANQESAILLKADGEVLAINEVGAKRFGRHIGEIIGNNLYDYMPPELAHTRREWVAQTLRSREPVAFEDRRSGIDFHTTLYPIVDDHGEVIQVAVYAKDITAQRRAAHVEQMLHALDRHVLSGATQTTILEYLCREVVHIFNLRLAWVGRKERDGSISIQTGAGPALGYLDDLRTIGVRWDQTAHGAGPAGSAIRSGFIQRTRIDSPQFSPWREAAEHYAFRGIIALPLLVRGEIFGVVTLYADDADLLENGPVREWLDAITDRLRLTLDSMMDHNQLRLLGTALGAAGNGVMITDKDGRIQWVNEAFTRMSGYSMAELLGQTPRILKSGEHDACYYEELWQAIGNGRLWSGDTVERAKDGTCYTVRQTITPILGDDGQASHFITIHEDITQQKADEERIQFLAHYDQLTELPNRRLFQDRLQQALALSSRNTHGVGLLFLDLDRFKMINDTLGHAAGDLLLQQVAQRLRQCLRESDTVARIGGDEFTVLMPLIQHREECAAVAEKIVTVLSCPFDLNGTEVRSGTSIGIATCPADGTSSDELLRAADAAMYRAKSAGGGYRFTAA